LQVPLEIIIIKGGGQSVLGSITKWNQRTVFDAFIQALIDVREFQVLDHRILSVYVARALYDIISPASDGLSSTQNSAWLKSFRRSLLVV
jgi:hypothetical protein